MEKYTDEQFIKTVKTSFSIAEILRKIGRRPAGGNYKIAKNKIKVLKLNCSHFTGKGYLKGKTHNWSPKKPLENILISDSNYNSNRLRNRLIKEKVFEEKCYCCGNTNWLNKRIPLEIEHKNGNSCDNRLENLTLLCPNCHDFTPSYKRKKSNKMED